MKFFTKAWATGELPDEEFEAAIPLYRTYVASLALPDDAGALEATNIHDGMLERLNCTTSELSLVLITGDLQHGYFDTTITYLTNGLAASTVESLRSFVGRTDEELIYAEVDREGTDFVHRLLFSTYEDLDIPFKSVAIRQSPRGFRERPERPGG
jgi:hypothetical protein